MKLTLEYLSNHKHHTGIKAADVQTFLRSFGFKLEDGPSGEKWKQVETGRVVSFSINGKEAMPAGVRDVYFACLEVQKARDAAALNGWVPFDLPNDLGKNMKAFSKDNKGLLRYADFPEFMREYENNARTGSAEEQLRLQIFKLEEKYGKARAEALELQKKYDISFVRSAGKKITIVQEDLDIKIECATNGISMGDQLVVAIREAGKKAKATAEARLEQVLKLEEAGFTVNFAKSAIVLTHPDAKAGWNQQLDYDESSEIISKAGLTKMQNLARGEFPKALPHSAPTDDTLATYPTTAPDDEAAADSGLTADFIEAGEVLAAIDAAPVIPATPVNELIDAVLAGMNPEEGDDADQADELELAAPVTAPSISSSLGKLQRKTDDEPKLVENFSYSVKRFLEELDSNAGYTKGKCFAIRTSDGIYAAMLRDNFAGVLQFPHHEELLQAGRDSTRKNLEERLRNISDRLSFLPMKSVRGRQFIIVDMQYLEVALGQAQPPAPAPLEKPEPVAHNPLPSTLVPPAITTAAQTAEATVEDDAPAAEAPAASSTRMKEVKNLRSISLDDFKKDPKAHLYAASKEGPKAIKNADGTTFVVIMPMDRHTEFAQIIGSKTTTWETMNADLQGSLESINSQAACVVIKSNLPGSKDTGFILRADYEEDVISATEDKYLQIDLMPDTSDHSAPASADTAAQADDLELAAPATAKPVEYSYGTISYSSMFKQILDFRRLLDQGKIQIAVSPDKILAVYIPESLMDKALPEGCQWTEFTGNQHFRTFKEGRLATRDFDDFYKIQPQIANFELQKEHDTKKPYGLISWDHLVSLAEKGAFPPIPKTIIDTVEKAYPRTIATKPKQSGKLSTLVAPKAAPTPEPAEPAPAAVVVVKLAPAPASTPAPAPGPITAELPKANIALGNILDVDLKGLGIQAKLAAIKAQKQLGETFTKVRESLKTLTGFLTVKVDEKEMYATTAADLVDNAADIAETFGIGCESVEIGANEPAIASKWMQAFKAAATNDQNFTVIKDKSLGKDVVIVPATDNMKDILNQLGINLE